MQHISHDSTTTIRLFFIFQMKQGFGCPCLDFPSEDPAGLKQQTGGKKVQWLDGLFQASSRSQELGWEAPCCTGWVGLRWLGMKVKLVFWAKVNRSIHCSSHKDVSESQQWDTDPCPRAILRCPRWPQGARLQLPAWRGRAQLQVGLWDQALQGRRCMQGC